VNAGGFLSLYYSVSPLVPADFPRGEKKKKKDKDMEQNTRE
jgi:hypothetical protein